MHGNLVVLPINKFIENSEDSYERNENFTGGNGQLIAIDCPILVKKIRNKYSNIFKEFL